MILIDIEMPKRCVDCPCAYWIQTGEYQGMLMCNVLEYKAGDKAADKGRFIVNEYEDRPVRCPMFDMAGVAVK